MNIQRNQGNAKATRKYVSIGKKREPNAGHDQDNGNRRPPSYDGDHAEADSFATAIPGLDAARLTEIQEKNFFAITNASANLQKMIDDTAAAEYQMLKNHLTRRAAGRKLPIDAFCAHRGG